MQRLRPTLQLVHAGGSQVESSELVDLAEETEAYAAYLNGVIAHPEDPELWEDLQKAKDALEVAWLEQIGETHDA
jgi:hypothetical protein